MRGCQEPGRSAFYHGLSLSRLRKQLLSRRVVDNNCTFTYVNYMVHGYYCHAVCDTSLVGGVTKARKRRCRGKSYLYLNDLLVVLCGVVKNLSLK